MITKDNLIGMLEKSLANEDEFVINYGKDFLDDEEKREIKDLMTALLEDTARHKETVELLIEKVKGDERNEF